MRVFVELTLPRRHAVPSSIPSDPRLRRSYGVRSCFVFCARRFARAIAGPGARRNSREACARARSHGPDEERSSPSFPSCSFLAAQRAPLFPEEAEDMSSSARERVSKCGPGLGRSSTRGPPELGRERAGLLTCGGGPRAKGAPLPAVSARSSARALFARLRGCSAGWTARCCQPSSVPGGPGRSGWSAERRQSCVS